MVLFQSFINKNVREDKIVIGLTWLCELLYRHFNEKTLVLIDDYDALVKSFLFKGNKDMTKITKLLGESEQHLLKFNNSFGTVLTGELRLYRGENVSCFVNLRDRLSEFYGIAEKELEHLLKGNNSKEKIKLNNFTDLFFGGYIYNAENKKVKIYRTESVIQYLLTESLNVSRMMRPEYLNGLQKLSRVKGLVEWLQILLSGKKVLHTHVELSQPIFHKDNILTLRMVMNHGKTEKTTITSVLFLTLLYYFGYLTPVDEKLRWFKIPNKSARDELKTILDGCSDALYDVQKIVEVENTRVANYTKSTVNLAGSESKPTYFMGNFLNVLKSKCIGEKINISSTNEIKRKIAKWFMEEHLPF
ncbi:uncharacterized protein LOC129000517 [Macrosteles quadrilineatus]|uniref:uncharacterized protein LOC129000517 n=1 Tax=Macrosteles quadrilineatus TaxID=74068 RepID=UPI0023E1C185|nr:uncharacterized protein LOC129000517 [Macrosteles quadrilineatus]